MSIQEWGPDFVLLVLTEKGQEKFNGLIAKLESRLTDNGFETQKRIGSKDGKSILLFAKISSAAYEMELEKQQKRDLSFGITSSQSGEANPKRIIGEFLTRSVADGGLGITPGQGEWTFVTTIVPLAASIRPTNLMSDLKFYFSNFDFRSGLIKDTYGVQAALYFEYMKYYTGWLIGLAVFGLVSYLKSKGRFLLTYSVINLVWGTLFITSWRVRERYLASLWGEKNVDRLERDNILRQEPEANEKSARIFSEVFVKQLAFIPVALLFALVLISYQLLCFAIEIFLGEIYNGPGKAFLTLVPTVLISVFVPILTIVYNMVAEILLDWENHKDVITRKRSALIKLYVLTFLTSYAPLLITSFIYLPFAHLIKPHLGDIQSSIANRFSDKKFYYKYLIQLKKLQDFQINQERLNIQFFYFIVTNQVIQVVLKYVLPLVLNDGVRIAKEKYFSKEESNQISDDEKEKRWLDVVRRTVALPEYDPNDDLRGAAVQYGYLILFGPVLSIAPAICIFFNVLTFKLDILKLSGSAYFRPSIAKRVESIKPWNYYLFLVTWLGSIISPIVTAFYRHGSKPPKVLGQVSLEYASVNTSTVKLLAILLFSEHLFLILWLVLSHFFSLIKLDAEVTNEQVADELRSKKDGGNLLLNSNPFTETPLIKLRKASESKSEVIHSVVNSGDDANKTESKQAVIGEVPKSQDINDEINAKKEILHEKQATLDQKKEAVTHNTKDALEKIKDKSDSVIESKDEAGNVVYSTMDDNSHFEPPAAVEKVKNLSDEAKASAISKKSSIKSALNQNADPDSSISGDADTTFGTANKSGIVKDAEKTLKDTSSKESSSISNGTQKKKKTIKKILGKKK